ncbi:MAG: hypothetical protein ABIZ80_07685 [Bryobacteraceae bacterium]
MGFGLRVVTELPWYYVGLDLGQRRDYSAVVIVERAELLLDEMDYVTYERKRQARYRVRYARRLPLGTPYPDVVARVREVLRMPDVAARCTLVMDATGVGTPVLDMLRGAGLRCPIEAVILTGGEREQHGGGKWHVPKRDVITGLQAMLDNGELEMSPNVPGAAELVQEMSVMRARIGRWGRTSFGAVGERDHDDLAMAAGLACWRARWKARGIWGTRSLGF